MHFLRSDYKENTTKVRKLKITAVPTLFGSTDENPGDTTSTLEETCSSGRRSDVTGLPQQNIPCDHNILSKGKYFSMLIDLHQHDHQSKAT